MTITAEQGYLDPVWPERVLSAGFYRFPGGGGAAVDPLIEDLIREEAEFAKITRIEVFDETFNTCMNATLRKLCHNLPPQKDLLSVLNKAINLPIQQMGALQLWALGFGRRPKKGPQEPAGLVFSS